MMTVRFSSHPVTAFEVDAFGETLTEEIVFEESVLPPETNTFASIADMETGFDAYFERVALRGEPALLVITWIPRPGEAAFDGFDGWAKHDMRVHYDKLEKSE